MKGMRWPVVALGAALAMFLAVVSLQRNMQRACEIKEWPHFSSCLTPDLSVDAQVRDLRAVIAANPGNSAAWLALALLTSQPPGVAPLDETAVLAVAARLTPQDALLLRLQAARALHQSQWAPAVSALVRLVQEHADPEATRALAALVGNPSAQPALKAALQPHSTWLEPVLHQLGSAGVPVVLAMPLVAEALPIKLVSARGGQMLLRELKANGQWLQAQALWVYLLGGKAPLLYNGGFEQGFIVDGFDWQLQDVGPSRSGVLIEQPVRGARGRVLQLEFTGRPVLQPMVRQVLVLAPGKYQFTGDYMARQMRNGQGLAWSFNCVAGGREMARTHPLKDTQGQWQKMDISLSVPIDCPAVVLQLQTQLVSEALSGLRGQMSFDALALSSGEGGG